VNASSDTPPPFVDDVAPGKWAFLVCLAKATKGFL
jgi:hypothetical protein